MFYVNLLVIKGASTLIKPKYEIYRRTQPHFHHPQQFFLHRQSHFLNLQRHFFNFQLRFRHQRLSFLHSQLQLRHQRLNFPQLQLQLRLPQLPFLKNRYSTVNLWCTRGHSILGYIYKTIQVNIVATCVKKNFCLLCRPIRRGFESGHVVIFFKN